MRKIIFFIILIALIQISVVNASTLEIEPLDSVSYTISNQSFISKSSSTEPPQAFVFNYKNRAKNVDVVLNPIYATGTVYAMIFRLNNNTVTTEINNFLEDNQNAGYSPHNGNTRYNLVLPMENVITKIKFTNAQNRFQLTVNESINDPFVILFLQKTPAKITVSYATFYSLELLEQKTVLNCEMNNRIIHFFCNESNQNCNNLRNNCLLTWSLNTAGINLDYTYIEPQTITREYNYELITTNTSKSCVIENYPIEQDGLNYRCVCVRSRRQNYYGVEKCFNGSTVVYGPYNKVWNPTNKDYKYLGEYPGNLNTSCWKGAITGCSTTMKWSTQIPVEEPVINNPSPAVNSAPPAGQTPTTNNYYTTTFTSGTTGDQGKCAEAGLQVGTFGCVCRPGASVVYAATCTDGNVSLWSIAACNGNTNCKTTAISCYSKPLSDCR